MSLFTKRYHKPGTAPGTLTSRVEPDQRRFSIDLVDYSANYIEVRRNIGAEACGEYFRRPTVTWN